VSGRSRLSYEEMIELDVRYAREWSPLLDLRILVRTPKAVLWSRDTA
jgi:lipopolysaccharide/colanic/teichoic acid biosynthesis glycosyltransferase